MRSLASFFSHFFNKKDFDFAEFDSKYCYTAERLTPRSVSQRGVNAV